MIGAKTPMTKLKRLCLRHTQVTDAGFCRLQAALPNLCIDGWYTSDG